MKFLLVVAFISGVYPYPTRINTYQVEGRAECLRQASRVFKQVKVGSVLAFCHSVSKFPPKEKT